MISYLVNTFPGFKANKKNNSNSFFGKIISFPSLTTLYSSLLIVILSNSIIKFLFLSDFSLFKIDSIFFNKIFGFTGLDI